MRDEQYKYKVDKVEIQKINSRADNVSIKKEINYKTLKMKINENNNRKFQYDK